MLVTKDEIKEVMEDLRHKTGFPEIDIPNEITEILNLNRTQLKSRPLEDLQIDCIRLGQYALYLRSQTNRMKATINWCDANINHIIGRELNNVKNNWFEEKKLSILRNDPVALQLNKIKSVAQAKLTSFEAIDIKLEHISKSINSLTFVRRRRDD